MAVVASLGGAPSLALAVGFFDWAFQPHLDRMQHAPINDPARHRFHQVSMRNAAEEVREVGVDNLPVSAE